jgi:hypothetical protein
MQQFWFADIALPRQAGQRARLSHYLSLDNAAHVAETSLESFTLLDKPAVASVNSALTEHQKPETNK